MRGQVLEINVSDPEKAVRILKTAGLSHQVPLDEVALYGAQIHAVVLGDQEYKPTSTNTCGWEHPSQLNCLDCSNSRGCFYFIG